MQILNRVVNKLISLYYLNRERNNWYNDFVHFKDTAKPVLTERQKSEVKAYFEKFGFDIRTDWHDYYTYMTGDFSVKYIPADLMYTVIVPYLNFMPFELAYQDKGSYWRLLPNVKQPRMFLQRVHSFFYDENHTPISLKEAAELCSNLQNVIIKPTVDSCQGRGVKLLSFKNGKTVDGTTPPILFDNYGDNFIIQERIQQSDFLSSLNESSLNTMRILTLRIGNDIIVLSKAIRIGGKGSITDNSYGGGFSCGIYDDGSLKEVGYNLTEGAKITSLQNGKLLKGLRIPHFDKVIDKAKELHLTLPYLRLIGWDFTIDKDNEPVFIEMNTLPGIYIMQLNNGPVFGEYTDQILEAVKNVKHALVPKFIRTYK